MTETTPFCDLAGWPYFMCGDPADATLTVGVGIGTRTIDDPLEEDAPQEMCRIHQLCHEHATLTAANAIVSGYIVNSAPIASVNAK